MAIHPPVVSVKTTNVDLMVALEEYQITQICRSHPLRSMNACINISWHIQLIGVEIFQSGVAVDQLTGITVPREYQTTNSLRYTVHESLLQSTGVKFEICGQVSDRAASVHQAVMPCLFSVHRVKVDAQTSVPVDRHRKHWHGHS